MSKDNKLSRDEILHLADLAKLTLNDQEIAKYQEVLGETIEYVKNLDELNTDNVAPTNSVVDLKNVTCDDGAKSTNGLTTKEALQNAPRVKNDEFVVPRIMQ